MNKIEIVVYLYEDEKHDLDVIRNQHTSHSLFSFITTINKFQTFKNQGEVYKLWKKSLV